MDQLPQPEDDEFVQLAEQPAEVVAVLSYSWAPDEVEKKRREQVIRIANVYLNKLIFCCLGIDYVVQESRT